MHTEDQQLARQKRNYGKRKKKKDKRKKQKRLNAERQG
jgi:hypothetical protein